MDVPICCDMKDSEDLNSVSESLADPPDVSCQGEKDLSETIRDLEEHFTECLSIQDNQVPTNDAVPMSGKEFFANLVIEGKVLVSSASEESLSQFAIDQSFQGTDSAELASQDIERLDKKAVKLFVPGECAQSGEQLSQQSMSLTTPLKLVSAMKGSRAKQGTPKKKLTVTWAPDVYDPPPSSVSHVPTNKGQRHSSKRNGKNKQKGGGKSSRGSKGKDKKQTRKSGGSTSSRSFKYQDSETSGCCSDIQASMIDFTIDSADRFCGSSFLKESISKLHFPVAEAT